jgi:hypothetical protein
MCLRPTDPCTSWADKNILSLHALRSIQLDVAYLLHTKLIWFFRHSFPFSTAEVFQSSQTIVAPAGLRPLASLLYSSLRRFAPVHHPGT